MRWLFIKESSCKDVIFAKLGESVPVRWLTFRINLLKLLISYNELGKLPLSALLLRSKKVRLDALPILAGRLLLMLLLLNWRIVNWVNCGKVVGKDPDKFILVRLRLLTWQYFTVSQSHKTPAQPCAHGLAEDWEKSQRAPSPL